MREQLIQYVNLLFAGAPDSDDIRQEILQNTLDRYDDLVSQGTSPEAAYRLAITGIGDINEILGKPESTYHDAPKYTSPQKKEEDQDDKETRTIKAWAIGLYICSPIPLFILSEFGLDTMGLCLTLLLIAAATIRLLMIRKNDSSEAAYPNTVNPAPNSVKNVVSGIVWGAGLSLYLLISILTHAWFVTWIIFPLCACIQGLINAIIDLKEANDYEI